MFPETNSLTTLSNYSDPSFILSMLDRGDKMQTYNNYLIQKTADFYESGYKGNLEQSQMANNTKEVIGQERWLRGWRDKWKSSQKGSLSAQT